MQENLERELERGTRLKAMKAQSEDLSQSAQSFRQRAFQLKKDMKRKENRTCLLASVGILILLVLIALSSMYFAA
jgi:predicted nucleic acid-binding Zn ribbon protein